jgi:hypothetical protein
MWATQRIMNSCSPYNWSGDSLKWAFQHPHLIRGAKSLIHLRSFWFLISSWAVHNVQTKTSSKYLSIQWLSRKCKNYHLELLKCLSFLRFTNWAAPLWSGLYCSAFHCNYSLLAFSNAFWFHQLWKLTQTQITACQIFLSISNSHQCFKQRHP